MKRKLIAIVLTLTLLMSLAPLSGVIAAKAIDTSALQEQVMSAKALIYKGYGEQSRKYLADRVQRAEAVVYNDYATEEDIAAAGEALQTAVDSLAPMYAYEQIALDGIGVWDAAALSAMTESSAVPVKDVENKPADVDFSIAVSAGDGRTFFSNIAPGFAGVTGASPFGRDMTKADGVKLWVSVDAPATLTITLGRVSVEGINLSMADVYVAETGYIHVPFDCFTGDAVIKDGSLNLLSILAEGVDSFRFADLNAYNEILEGSTKTPYSETLITSRNQIENNAYYKIIETGSGKAITYGPEITETNTQWNLCLDIEDSRLQYSLEENREGDRTQMWQLSPSPAGNGSFRLINKSSTNAIQISSSGGSIEAKKPALNETLQEWTISISKKEATIQVRNVGKLTVSGDTVKATTGSTYKKFYLYKVVETEYVQSWSDEFDGDELDRNKWSVDDGFWFGGSVSTIHTDDDQQLNVSDGMLNMTVTPDRYGSYEMQGTYMSTSGRFAFSYGKVEIRAKLAYGNGQFPAFWMMPTDMMNMGGGEIDIMEIVVTDDIRKNGEQIGTIHWTSDDGYTHWSKVHYMPIYGYGEKYLSDEFHTYGVEMDHDQIRYYFDGMQYNSLVLNSEGKRFAFGDMARYIIINNSTKGDDASIVKEAWGLEDEYVTQIDYVRCYLEAGEITDNTVNFTTDDSINYSSGIEAVATNDAWDINFAMDINCYGNEGAVADHYSNLYIFDPYTGETLRSIYIANAVAKYTRSFRVLYSPDATKLAVANTQGCIVIYNTSNYDNAPIKIYNGAVIQENVLFTPDSKYLIVGGFNGGSQAYSNPQTSGKTEKWRFRVFDAATGAKLQDIDVGSDPRYIAISDDGTKVAVTTTSNGTFIYNVADWSEYGHITEGHSGAIRGADFSSDGSLLVTSDDEGVINVWNVADLTLNKKINNVNSGSVRRVVFSPDDKNILATATYGAARLFEVESGELISLLGGFGNVIREATYSTEGKFIAVASYDGGAKLFASDGTYLETLRAGETDENGEGFILSRIKFSPYEDDYVMFSTRTDPYAVQKWNLPKQYDKTQLMLAVSNCRDKTTPEYAYAAQVVNLKYATPQMIYKAYTGIGGTAKTNEMILVSPDGYEVPLDVTVNKNAYVYVTAGASPEYANLALKVTNTGDGTSKLIPTDDNAVFFINYDENDELQAGYYLDFKVKMTEAGVFDLELVDLDSDKTFPKGSVTVNGDATAADGFLYSINNGEVTITKCISGRRDVVIPSEIDGYPVTKIGSYAFYSYGTNVMHMKVTLPDTLKEIGSYAFYNCWSLREIKFPAGLEKIDQYAFNRCRLLSTVEIPAGTVVNSYAFKDAGVGTIILNSGSGIASSSLSGMSRVREIIVADGIQNLSLSISSQYLLEAVYIPESVTSISGGIYNFVDTSSLHTKYLAKIYGVEGSYAQTYAEANPTKFVFVPICAPTINGVEDGKTYDLYEAPVSATWENGHIGYLNGEALYRHADITEPGEYTLEVINGYDDYKTTVHFTVVDTTPPPYTIGDVDDDGEIAVTDALAALRIALGLAEPQGYQNVTADVDGDGIVTVSDVLRILRAAAGFDN
ncbi:MAG: leucine-rich repeat protein [Clostridia bacterium]|nr:leucine-rich repeat protein [Clostridia bacterium]